MRALLVHVRPHRRTLVVAAVLPRLVTASSCDGGGRGRVRAQGTHVELVEADELYRELAATQLTA
jgi:ABC-type transport system involved in Fe-S cluster assembly fused permease/ATPase subunit